MFSGELLVESENFGADRVWFLLYPDVHCVLMITILPDHPPEADPSCGQCVSIVAYLTTSPVSPSCPSLTISLLRFCNS